MRCPKCDSDLERVKFDEIEVDRCQLCQGLWFDMLEKEDLLAMQGSAKIDIGSDAKGHRYDQLRDIKCPRCNIKMLPMVDKDQYHIKYESCPICYGTFFDAGEFRDLKEHTVLERFLEMLKTLRSNL